MKILFVLENYMPHIGGAEVLFKNLAEGLVKKGHKINIVTHRIKGTKSFEVINGVNVYRINCLHSRYWFSIFSIPAVLKLARKADIIHTTTYTGTLPAIIASKILRKPSVITVLEILGKNWQKFGGMGFFSAKMHQFLEWIIMKLKFDFFVSISNSTESSVLRYVHKKKSSVVYPAVDYDIFEPKKYDERIRREFNLEKNFIYFFYGRPGISKGLEYLINAVPLIKQKITNAKLLAVVSRDRTYKKRYNHILKLIKKLGVEKDVIMLGSVPFKELPYYIKAADCVVVPSLTEGFGLTAVESNTMGKPVIASDTTSLPEVISGKYLLVKPADEKAIAEGVYLASRGKFNKTKLKKFTKEKSIEQYICVYKKLLKK